MLDVPCRFDLSRLLFSRPVASSSVRRDLSAAATLALALLASAAIGSPAYGQSFGCNRCSDETIRIGPFSFPNPFAGAQPTWGAPPSARVRRSWERRWSGDSQSRRRVASSGHEYAGGSAGGSVFVCVRTCDGGFFPLPYSGSSGGRLEEICQALCPNAEVALYAMPFGGTIDEGVSLTGSRYTAQPNALKFQQSYEASCSCRRPGQTWADALTAAEAKYGHRSHEIVVTAEASAQMSRPKLDPNTKPRTANAIIPNDSQPFDADPGLDVNGVDTRLKAATAAVSRETSGIRDEDAKAGSRFGLKDGHVVEEDDPDGGRRRVRILATMF